MEDANLSGFYDQTRAAKKILVVDLGFFGDTLQLLPALWEIKQHYPQAELHVLSSPLGAEVVRLAPWVERAWSMMLDPAQRSWREQLMILHALREERFDVAFNFGGNDRTIIMTALSGASWRVAHAAGRDHFWNRWLIANWVPRQNPELPVAEQRRQVLACCGFNLQAPQYKIEIDATMLDWGAQVVPEGAIHLSINSANPLKEWPLEHHIVLLRNLWHQFPDLQCVASAGTKPREKQRLQAFAEAVNDARLKPLPENLTLAQLATVLTRCRLHLGPDSGVMHLAVALGIPSVSFFRAQKGYQAWLPSGSEHSNIIVSCPCIDHAGTACDTAQRAVCLAKIEPQQVAEIVSKRLGRQTNPSPAAIPL